MANAPEQLIAGMRFTAARVLSRRISEESRKAGVSVEPYCSLELKDLSGLDLGTCCLQWVFMATELFPKSSHPFGHEWLIRHILDIVTNLIIRAKHKIEQL